MRELNWRAIWGIIRKDLRVVFQSKSVVLPMIFVPLITIVVLPLGLAIGLNYFGPRIEQSSDFNDILALVPPALLSQFEGYTVLQIGGLFILRYMFAPLYLILPIMMSSVIAADAFAGEKERKTLEALLYTPTTDRELMLSKLLGAWVPAVLVAWICALVYWTLVDIAAWPIYGWPILPDLTWIVLALWVAPMASAAALGATVIVSARAKTFQDAYQIGGFVILPVAILMLGQTLGVIILNTAFTFLVGFVFFVVAAVLVAIGTRTLRRGELLARL